MKKRYSLALLTAATLTLAACGGGSSSTPLPPGPEITETDAVFTGNVTLNLAGYEIVEQNEVSRNNTDTLQFLFFARNPQNIVCGLGLVFHSNATTIEDEFAAFSSGFPGPTGSIITSSTISAPNGTGRELVHSVPLDDATDSITYISHLYHFTAEQQTSGVPTTTLITCLTLTSSFGAAESSMRGVLASVTFEEDNGFADQPDQPWYASTFGPVDGSTEGTKATAAAMADAMRGYLVQ